MATKKRPISEVVSKSGKTDTIVKKSVIVTTNRVIVPLDLPQVAVKLGKNAEFSSYRKSKKALPDATVEARRDLEAGNLTRYVDEDDMFRKLGIKVGKKKA
jgi:hypothetical protein